MTWNPDDGWLTACNSCEAAEMVEGDPRGYCAECAAEADAATGIWSGGVRGPTYADQDPVYRAQMRDSGHGAYLR